MESNLQLKDVFEQDLAAEAIVNEGKLWTFRQLADKYGCSVSRVKRMVDSYVATDRLQAIRGVGTFLIDGSREMNIKLSHQIAVIDLDDRAYKTINQLTEKYLMQGGIFSIYHAKLENQSPAREKQILELACKNNFEGVILYATPIKPLNTALYLQLRNKGIKIAHLSPYCMDMSKETSFYPDYHHTGQVAAAKFAVAGYRHVLMYPQNFESPCVTLAFDGCRKMGEQLGLDIHSLENNLPPGEIVRRAGALDGRTAIFCIGTDIGAKIAGSPGYDSRRMGICALWRPYLSEEEISCFYYDDERQITDAFLYVSDPGRSPFETICRKYDPMFQDKKSF